MTTNPQPVNNLPMSAYTPWNWFQFFLFWSWNLIFLAFMSLGFAPVMLPETFIGVRTGMIPAAYLLYALILALIPVCCVILGLTVLRRSPSRLFALGYVIEGPLMLVLAVRFFLIRQATLGVTIALLVVLLGMAAFLWTILDRRSGERGRVFESLRLAGLTLMAITSLYAAVWIGFYAIPGMVELLRGLVNFLTDMPDILRNLWRELVFMFGNNPIMLPFSVFSFLLLLYTATLFVLAPIAVPVLSLRLWWRSLSRQVKDTGWVRPAALAAVTTLSVILLFVIGNRQPQARAFAMLEQPPATMEQARSLLERSESIRTGLLNAYLAPFRYISAHGEVRHIRDIYHTSLSMPEVRAFFVQRMYERLASPLLYQPVHPQTLPFADNRALVEEPRQAAALYQRFFDTPIVEGERNTIVAAARSTWSPDQAEEAWQAVDDREIRLVSQELTIQEHGDWADLELHEAYQNQTGDLQEVIYYFSLPESAVITGVWLGNSGDKSQAFDFQVAPRGAAQAVYREETRVMRDPALVEQLGPRQYRLRVYPVPQMRTDFDLNRQLTLVNEAPLLHMWLSWREMAQPTADGNAAWLLPKLAFLRNVYWDDNTERIVNGQTIQAEGDGWMPVTTLAAEGAVPGLTTTVTSAPQAHRVDLPGEQTVLAMPEGNLELPQLSASTRLALVIDRSRSMQSYAQAVEDTLAQLQVFDTSDSPVDVYLTASPYRGEAPSMSTLQAVAGDEIVYFGGQNAAQLIAQFEQLRQENGSDGYDAILVLTDGSGYELGETDIEVPIPPAPVWMVHLNGDLPLGYDDQTLDAIQASGGGITGGIESALARIAISLQDQGGVLPSSSPVTDLIDGYIWSVLPTEAADAAANAALLPDVELVTHAADEPFAALAARRLILAEMQRNKGSIDQLETLDALHALAMQYGIVTPYSSMIVLVEAEQQHMLDKLSTLEDRYDREVESLGDTTPRSPMPLTGVPEPHEWLLMGMAAALLVYLIYTKRRQGLLIRR